MTTRLFVEIENPGKLALIKSLVHFLNLHLPFFRFAGDCKSPLQSFILTPTPAFTTLSLMRSDAYKLISNYREVSL